METHTLPPFELIDESGAVFRSDDLRGLRWILAVVDEGYEDTLSLLESRHVKTMMMNAPIVAVCGLDPQDVSDVRKRLSSRLKMLSDPGRAVIESTRLEAGGDLVVLDRQMQVAAVFTVIDMGNLDRAVRRASRL